MSKKSKSLKIITGSALAFALLVAGGASVNAATTETRTNPMDNLVTAIATKFNLNTADVQAVFNEHKGQMGAQMKAQHSATVADRLSAAVTKGKLTQAQADLIKAKLVELEATREAKRGTEPTLTDAERKTVMKTEMETLKAWMTANNIPPEFMMIGQGKGKGHHGPRGTK